MDPAVEQKQREQLLERCELCGACTIGKTKGICPLSRCVKGLLNGPCGSMWEGLCGNVGVACIHVAIRKKLASEMPLKLAILPPRDYSIESFDTQANTSQEERM